MAKRTRRRPERPPRVPYVARPFEGLPGEPDWVALREVVPAATAPVRLAEPAYREREVLCVSLLPMAWPALVRPDGAIWLGLQVQHASGDVSRDLAATLEQALATEPGSPVLTARLPGPGPRLQDLLDLDHPFEVTVHSGFDFWVAGSEQPTADVAASLEHANAAADPTVRLDTVEAAYWTRAAGKEHLRWVMSPAEDAVLDALARLHAVGQDRVGEGSRLVGSFRTHGHLVPVWELAPGTDATDVAGPAADLAARLAPLLAAPRSLDAEERRARAGLATRQVTIR